MWKKFSAFLTGTITNKTSMRSGLDWLYSRCKKELDTQMCILLQSRHNPQHEAGTGHVVDVCVITPCVMNKWLPYTPTVWMAIHLFADAPVVERTSFRDERLVRLYDRQKRPREWVITRTWNPIPHFGRCGRKKAEWDSASPCPRSLNTKKSSELIINIGI